MVIGGKAVENALGRFPHVQRHRIMPLWIVEDDLADAAFLAGEHLVCLGHVSFLCQSALAWRSAAISRPLKPNSLRMASVCSPRSGGRAARREGVRDNMTGCRSSSIMHLSFRVTGWTKPRCCTCGSAKT